ncbi:MAG: glycosyltransferase [Chloroflexi bacterium]|nr:glycosyltransferase [Chloroflexota bacterium]
MATSSSEKYAAAVGAPDRPASRPRRVLYVEKASGVGGSTVGLHRLAANLDRARYQPIVLFYGPNQYVPQFVAQGLQVIVLGQNGAERAKSGTRTWKNSALVRTLKRLSWVRRAYCAAKICEEVVFKTLPQAWHLREVIHRHRIDLVHLNDEPVGNREGIIASMLAGVPCICHGRQYGEASQLDRVLARVVTFAIYMSYAMKTFWESHWSARPGRVVYDALPLDGYLAARDSGPVRAEFGLAADDFVLANVGRIVEWKGHKVLLRALASARRTAPTVKCLIVGEPDPPDDTRYIGEIRELARSLDVEDAVIFSGFRTDIPRILSGIDVLVHSATEPEPFGLTLIEGMAAAKPVIGTNAGGVPEIIENDGVGILVPPGDVEALATAITTLALDGAKAVKMGKAARQSVLRRFTIERFVAEVQDIYDRVLQPNETTGPGPWIRG